MIQLQVRAKSGLHAGATWYVNHSSVTLGASSGADIFLCDPDMPDTLITLKRYGRRYVIEHVDPIAKLHSSDHKPVDGALFPSQTVHLDFRHIQLELMLISMGHGLISRLGEAYTRTFHTLLQFLRGMGAKAIVSLLFLVGLFITSMILFFGTAGVAKTHASVLIIDQQKNADVSLQKTEALHEVMINNITQEMEKLSQRLSTKGIEVSRNKASVQIKAELSRSQLLDFERELIRVARDYGQFVSIAASVQPTAEQKQVDELVIEQIVLGKVPAVVLKEGVMLYQGANYKGLTVTSVTSNKITLKGKAVYEVII